MGFLQDSIASWRWCAVVSAFLLIAGVNADFSMQRLSTVYLPSDIQGSEPVFMVGEFAVENFAFDTDAKIIYVVGIEILHVVNASDANNLQRILSMKLPGVDVLSVDFCGDFVFISVDNTTDREQGALQVYRKYAEGSMELEFLQEVVVGVIPDFITVRPDCKTVLVALEAEGYEDGNTLKDEKGAVIIVEFQDGADSTSNVRVNKLGFEQFNDQLEELQETGFRASYLPAGATLDRDIEPEYFAVNEECNVAYVSLQENNGIAVVDLDTENITAIHGLGYKQYKELDASDKDQGIEITFWPIKGIYQPDLIKYYEWHGRKLLFTANEGDSKTYDVVGFSDAVRGKDIPDSEKGDEIPEFVRSAMNNDAQLGRLKFSSVDGRYPNGTYHTLYTFGGRSFSIFDIDKDFDLVYDSGSQIEKSTALYCPHLFNAEEGEVDSRSDDKGTETEAIEVAELAGRLYIFVGNEKPGTISVYSLGKCHKDKPRFEMIYCDGLPDNGKTYQQLFDDREMFAVDPEELKFYPASVSPSGTPILVVAGTGSATISVLELSATPDPEEECEGTKGNKHDLWKKFWKKWKKAKKENDDDK